MKFFSRYRLVMNITFTVVICLSLGFFAYHSITQYHSTLKLVFERFQKTAEDLDSTLKGIADHVNGARLYAERFSAEHTESNVSDTLAKQLRQLDDKSYAMEELPAGFLQNTSGNISGVGSLKGRDKSFYNDLRMAFSLNPLFQIAFHNLSSVTWAYFTSVERFVLIFPWTSHKDYLFSESELSREFFRLGLPENNPSRQIFWTDAYLDAADKGFLVTCGAPVYSEEGFRGTVAVDTTLARLSSTLKKFPFPYASLALVNSNNQLLAHSSLVSGKDQTVKTFSDSLPPGIGSTEKQLLELPIGGFQNLGEYVVATYPLTLAPWKLVIFVPRTPLLIQLMSRSSLLVGFLLIAMTAVLLIANHFTKKEFVAPAEKLVAHIERSSREPGTPIPTVPSAWQPWFEIISKIFADNARLLSELREQNAHLDQLVAQRTKELSIRNDELEQTMGKLKEMQQQIVMQEKMAALGGLTAGIAHEIKNPLNFVNNFSQLSVELFAELTDLLKQQQERFDTEVFSDIESLIDDLKTNAEKINEHGKRADSIVRGMLLHSRGKSGEHQKTDVNSLVREYVGLAYHGMRAQDASFNVKIETSFDPEAGMMDVIPQDLSRAVLNLVNNACYAAFEAAATREAGFMPTVWISTVVTGNGLEVHVRDNGNGMSEELRKKIFTPFFTTKPPGKGTGLGLSLSYDIVVQQHHGDLTVESTEKVGTEFTIRLPREKSAAVGATQRGSEYGEQNTSC